MAYLDLHTDRNFAPAGFARPEVRRQEGLSSMERGAVMLARSDRKDSLRPASRLYRLSVICFGFPRRPNMLADPRLEALRRYAVAFAHDSTESAVRERSQLVELGFSEHQISIAAGIASHFRPQKRYDLWIWLLLVAVVADTFVWADRYLEDHLISLVLAMTLTIPAIAMFAPRSGR